MDIKIIDDSRKDLWEKFVYANPHSIAWQGYEWRDVLEQNYKFTFYPIAAMENDTIKGILPLYHMKTLLSKDVLISVPFAVAGGLVADSDDVKSALLNKAIEVSKTYNSCRIILKQYKIKVPGELQVDENYYNRELDISKDISEIWNGFDDANKKNIDIAKKFEPILEYPSSDINGFYKVLLKHHHDSGIPCVSIKWIETLVASKMYSIALLKDNGKIVTATMVKEFKKTASFPFTCTASVDERIVSFAYFMYWKLIEHYCLKGFEIVHSGRIPNNNATLEYRLGWGGDKKNYYYQYYPSVGKKTEFATRRGRKRVIFEKYWKQLPQSVVEWVGPKIVKHFP